MFLLISLSSIAVPGFNGFVGEFLILDGLAGRLSPALVVAGLAGRDPRRRLHPLDGAARASTARSRTPRTARLPDLTPRECGGARCPWSRWPSSWAWPARCSRARSSPRPPTLVLRAQRRRAARHGQRPPPRPAARPRRRRRGRDRPRPPAASSPPRIVAVTGLVVLLAQAFTPQGEPLAVGRALAGRPRRALVAVGDRDRARPGARGRPRRQRWPPTTSRSSSTS